MSTSNHYVPVSTTGLNYLLHALHAANMICTKFFYCWIDTANLFQTNLPGKRNNQGEDKL